LSPRIGAAILIAEQAGERSRASRLPGLAAVRSPDSYRVELIERAGGSALAFLDGYRVEIIERP
jgi:hypothetical protein